MSESSKSKFPTMEDSATRGFDNASAAPSKNTKRVAKKNTAAGDPTLQKPSIKSQVKSPNAQGRSGASYVIKAKFNAHQAPEAGATLANGRILKPAKNRQAPDFQAGMTE